MFAKRLKAARKLRGLTLQYMAYSVNMALRSYQHYESGCHTPPFETLIKIADILNVPVDYLLGRDEFLKSLGVNVNIYKSDKEN